jgi:hypothetical protein
MSSRHRRYLLLEQGVGAGVVNVVINAAIAWLMFRGAAAVPLWGQQSIGGDMIGTAFMLPFMTALIATRIVRGQVRGGHVPGLALATPSVLQRLPRTPAGRGAVLGAICIVVVGVPATLVLGALGVSEMAFGSFIGFKAAFAGVFGALVTPVLARLALADA